MKKNGGDHSKPTGPFLPKFLNYNRAETFSLVDWCPYSFSLPLSSSLFFVSKEFGFSNQQNDFDEN